MMAAPIAPETIEFVPNHGSSPRYSSPSNFELLLQNHRALVKSIVDRMKCQFPARIEIEDLYSVGVTGLVHYFRDSYSRHMRRSVDGNRQDNIGSARATRTGAQGEEQDSGGRRLQAG